jgi:hypothetical protein
MLIMRKKAAQRGLLMAGAAFLLRIAFISLYGSAFNSEVYTLSLQLAVTMIGTSYHVSCFGGVNRGGETSLR